MCHYHSSFLPSPTSSLTPLGTQIPLSTPPSANVFAIALPAIITIFFKVKVLHYSESLSAFLSCALLPSCLSTFSLFDDILFCLQVQRLSHSFHLSMSLLFMSLPPCSFHALKIIPSTLSCAQLFLTHTFNS